MVVRVASPLANGTSITNTTYSIDSNETAPVAGAAVSTTVSSAPLLSVSKTDSPDPVAAGGTLTYTLSYSNTGNANATGVVLTDTVPANTTFVSATTGGTLRSEDRRVAKESRSRCASDPYKKVVRVASPLANGTSITNSTYSIDSNETSPVNGAAVPTASPADPTLSASMTDAPDPVGAGANLTYTIAYTNSGATGATGVVLTDTVPANTTFVSATTGGTLASGVVTWSPGNLAAGATGSVQIVVRVASPLASATSTTTATNATNSTTPCPFSGATFPTAVTSAPILAVSKTDSPDPVAAGGNLTYTLSYSNTGNANATGVVITDTVPANTTFVSATAGGILASGVVTWSVGNLAAGASGSVQLVVRVASPLANGTSITNSTYSIDSNETSPVNGAAVSTATLAGPTLSASMTDAPDPVGAGANLTYTIAYSNTGNANATGVVLTDTVPANTTFVSATAGGTLASGVVTWSIGNLAAGASGSVQMVVRVASPIADEPSTAIHTHRNDSDELLLVAGDAVSTAILT